MRILLPFFISATLFLSPHSSQAALELKVKDELTTEETNEALILMLDSLLQSFETYHDQMQLTQKALLDLARKTLDSMQSSLKDGLKDGVFNFIMALVELNPFGAFADAVATVNSYHETKAEIKTIRDVIEKIKVNLIRLKGPHITALINCLASTPSQKPGVCTLSHSKKKQLLRQLTKRGMNLKMVEAILSQSRASHASKYLFETDTGYFREVCYRIEDTDHYVIYPRPQDSVRVIDAGKGYEVLDEVKSQSFFKDKIVTSSGFAENRLLVVDKVFAQKKMSVWVLKPLGTFSQTWQVESQHMIVIDNRLNSLHGHVDYIDRKFVLTQDLKNKNLGTLPVFAPVVETQKGLLLLHRADRDIPFLEVSRKLHFPASPKELKVGDEFSGPLLAKKKHLEELADYEPFVAWEKDDVAFGWRYFFANQNIEPLRLGNHRKKETLIDSRIKEEYIKILIPELSSQLSLGPDTTFVKGVLIKALIAGLALAQSLGLSNYHVPFELYEHDDLKRWNYAMKLFLRQIEDYDLTITALWQGVFFNLPMFAGVQGPYDLKLTKEIWNQLPSHPMVRDVWDQVFLHSIGHPQTEEQDFWPAYFGLRRSIRLPLFLAAQR